MAASRPPSWSARSHHLRTAVFLSNRWGPPQASRDSPEESRVPFHFDYIDSTVPNAIAFDYEGYSFIGVTMALICAMVEVCHRISRSASIVGLLGVSAEADDWHKGLFFVLFQAQLHLVVSHEYTHHLLGHVLPVRDDSRFPNEVLQEAGIGSIEQQVSEIDADINATAIGLHNLICGRQRSSAILRLQIEAEPDSVQDEVLIYCFIVAAISSFYIRPPIQLDNTSAYRLTHPPQALRINYVISAARTWCERERTALVPRLTLERFHGLWLAIDEAMREMKYREGDSPEVYRFSHIEGASWEITIGDWIAQDKFLRSSEGLSYIARVRTFRPMNSEFSVPDNREA